MVTKVHHSLPATGELYALIDLIKHPDKYKKVIDKIENLINEYNDKIELIGKVGEIDAVRNQIILDRQETALVLEEAKSDAAKIRAAAKDRIAKKEQSLQDHEKELEEKSKEFGRYSSQKERELSNQKTSLTKREEDVVKREHAADVRDGQAAEALDALNRKRSILEQTARDLG